MSLPLIRTRAVQLREAFVRTSPTRTMLAGFDELIGLCDAAIGRPAAVKPAPRVVTVSTPPELPNVTEPESAEHVKCPRCLSPYADRGHVEQHGLCIDCVFAGHRAPEPLLAPAADAVAALPPAALAGTAAGAGAVPAVTQEPPPSPAVASDAAALSADIAPAGDAWAAEGVE